MCEREEGELGEKTRRRRRRWTTTKTAEMEVKMLFLAKGNRWGNSGEGSVRRAAQGGAGRPRHCFFCSAPDAVNTVRDGS